MVIHAVASKVYSEDRIPTMYSVYHVIHLDTKKSCYHTYVFRVITILSIIDSIYTSTKIVNKA